MELSPLTQELFLNKTEWKVEPVDGNRKNRERGLFLFYLHILRSGMEFEWIKIPNKVEAKLVIYIKGTDFYDMFLEPKNTLLKYSYLVSNIKNKEVMKVIYIDQIGFCKTFYQYDLNIY